MSRRRQDNSKTVMFFKIRGIPFGIFKWSRHYGKTKGVVLRLGSIGHFQLQISKKRVVGHAKEGRRKRHYIQLSKWGVNGRRRKISLGVYVDF